MIEVEMTRTESRKCESLAAFLGAQEEHLSDFYDQGFADGIMSVHASIQDQAKIDAIVGEITQDMDLMEAAKVRDAIDEVLRRFGFGPPPKLSDEDPISDG